MLIGRLRRFRWLASLLVVLSPPVAGSLIPVIDPCPIDTPWLVQDAAPAHTGHGDHHTPDQHASTDADEAGHQHSTCHCIGACAGAATAGTVPDGGAVLAETPTTVISPSGAPAPLDGVARPRFLLPPAHAPPVA